ncbi:Uncharacterized protein HZ326_27725 [Fusarium oxysporum f. sp. albedinis]|nr:Uncharacterized protein HZ326_27725 [Fusarium oxysporum f. sp. albedinis]
MRREVAVSCIDTVYPLSSQSSSILYSDIAALLLSSYVLVGGVNIFLVNVAGMVVAHATCWPGLTSVHLHVPEPPVLDLIWFSQTVTVCDLRHPSIDKRVPISHLFCLELD